MSDDFSANAMEKFLENEANKIALQNKKLDHENAEKERQYKYAIEALKQNADLLKEKPNEDRKSFKVLARYILALIIIVLAFLGVMTYLGYIEIVTSILSHTFAVIVAYFGGKYRERYNIEAEE